MIMQPLACASIVALQPHCCSSLLDSARNNRIQTIIGRLLQLLGVITTAVVPIRNTVCGRMMLLCIGTIGSLLL